MTATIVKLPARAAKAEAPRSFNFTATALRKACAAFDKEAAQGIVLRDEGCRGLIVRKQKRDWVAGIERKIRRKIWRETFGPVDLPNVNIAALREQANITMAAIMSGDHVPRTIRTEAQGEADDLSRTTWAAAVDLHASHNPLTRESTIRSYRFSVQRLPSSFPAKIATTTDAHIRAAYADVLARTSAATASATLRSLSALWNTWADAHQKDKRPTSNPIATFKGDGRRGVKRIAKVAPRTNALRPAERAKWIAYALDRMTALGPSGGTYAALAWLALTGMRAQEGLALQWAEVHGEEIVIRAERMKTDDEFRRPITPRLRTILDHQKTFHPDSPFVFPSRIGDGPVGDARKTLEMVNSAALPEGRRITLHDLRRTFITGAEMAGAPSIAARLLTAHSAGDVHDDYARAIKTELGRYAILIEDELTRHV